jgi:ribonuclease P protein component
VIESKPRDPIDQAQARIGYTVTKQMGNAPVRNRIRRRLREAMRLCDRALLRPGHDYVLIARAASLQRGFADLRADLEAALGRLVEGKVAGKHGTGQASRFKSNKSQANKSQANKSQASKLPGTGNKTGSS